MDWPDRLDRRLLPQTVPTVKMASHTYVWYEDDKRFAIVSVTDILSFDPEETNFTLNVYWVKWTGDEDEEEDFFIMCAFLLLEVSKTRFLCHLVHMYTARFGLYITFRPYTGPRGVRTSGAASACGPVVSFCTDLMFVMFPHRVYLKKRFIPHY